MSVPASRKRALLCLFNLNHKWVRRFNPEGADYLQCKACGKEHSYAPARMLRRWSATSRAS